MLTLFRRALWLLARFGLVLVVTALTLGLAELALRVTGISERIVRARLVFQNSDLAVYRESADRFQRYELVPGASGAFEGGEPTPRPYTVHVSSAGARGPDRPVPKPPATYRVLCVGGSTMYGAGVNDDQTLAAALERALTRRLPGSGATGLAAVEAWNYGMNGKNVSQAARLAREKLDLLQPDLVVLQPYPTGPRMLHGALLDGGDLAPTYADDPDFILENFPPPDGASRERHEGWFRRSALYRVVVAVARSTAGLRIVDTTRDRETRALADAATARGIPVLYPEIPASHALRVPDWTQPVYLNLNAEGREPEFYAVHPPAPVLAGFAETIADAIVARGWLHVRYRAPAATPAGPLPSPWPAQWTPAWSQALLAVMTVLEGAVVVLAVALPLLGLIWGVRAAGRRRRRRGS